MVGFFDFVFAIHIDQHKCVEISVPHMAHDGRDEAQVFHFVLHGPEQSFENTLAVSEDIRLTLSRDIIDAMAAGNGPARSLIALGYAGWEAGQLEDEMLANSWLNVPATPEIVFDTPFEDRWDSAARTLGIDIACMSPDAGHA